MKIVDKESKTNLPRWFNGVSIILKNMRCGSLEIILPDNRSFIYRGIEKGPKGKIKTTINPIRTLTPRFIQKIIDRRKITK